MTHQASDDHTLFLWTVPARRADKLLALSVLALSIVVFAAAVPYAKTPLERVPGFIPIYESVLVVNDLMTSALLFGQFAILRARSLFLLACAYLFTCFITIVHGLTFPGVFTPGGLLGAGPQTTAWLYMLWHGGFPVLVIGYTLLRARDDAAGEWKTDPRFAIPAGILAAAVAVGLCTWLTIAGHDALPAIMNGQRVNGTLKQVVAMVWGLGFIALAMLWRRRGSVLDLWLMVTMCAWIFDVGLSSVFDAARFDLGFYAGRIYGLLASSFVLIVLLLENGMLYARLAAAHEREKHRNAELVEANKELDSFSYSVSHDLRSPLRVVDGYGRMLEEDYGPLLDAEGRRLLDVMRSSSRQMGQLIDDLLTLSRLGRQPLRVQAVDMGKLTARVVAELQAECEGRTIDFRIAPLGSIDADPVLLKQLLLNLVGNAVKFTRNKEVAIIEIERTQDENGAATFVVRDNGAGFDMRYYDKLFGVFQRLHSADEFQGTGVGLAIVRRIAARHGGNAWAQAKPGEGASFYLSLPRNPSHEQA